MQFTVTEKTFAPPIGGMIAVRDIPGKGRGVLALRPFKAREDISTVNVLLIDAPKESWSSLTREPYEHVIYWDKDHFGIALGDISFCNHSDDPNCAMWRNTKEKTCTVMAIRDINEGEEITFDYQFTNEPWFEIVT